MKKLSIILICLMLVIPFAFADYWSCGDGASSTNSTNSTNATYLVWKNITVTNNTRMNTITHITADNAFQLMIAIEPHNLSVTPSSNNLVYHYIENTSLHMFNGTYGVNEILARNNHTGCYQETTNATTGTDGYCGLNYTGGTYNLTAGWTTGTETFDGLIITYGETDGTQNATMYANYTKPKGAYAAKWSVSDNNITALPWVVNVTIDNSCMIAYTDRLVLSVTSRNDTNASDWNCYNSTDWVDLRDVIGNRIYEEGIFWDIAGTWTQNMSVDGISFITIVNNTFVPPNYYYNFSYNRNISAGTDLANPILMNFVCDFGCPSYETNLSANYNINGNVSNFWRITTGPFTGHNWTVTWGEVARSCTWITSSGQSCQQTKTTLFAGFALLAVIGIAISAFLLINIFKDGMDGTAIMATALTVVGLGVILFVAYYIIGTLAMSTCV